MDKITDFDFAYFIGLCVALGEILGERLVIRFRYKTKRISLPSNVNSGLSRKSREYVIDTTLLKSKLEKFLKVDIETTQTEDEFSIVMPVVRESFSDKQIVSILGSHNFSFKNCRSS